MISDEGISLLAGIFAGLGFGYSKLIWNKFLLPLKQEQFQKLTGQPAKSKKLMRKALRNIKEDAILQNGATLVIPGFLILAITLIFQIFYGIGFIAYLGFLTGGILGNNFQINRIWKKPSKFHYRKRSVDQMQQIAMGALIAENSSEALAFLAKAVKSDRKATALNAVYAIVKSRSPQFSSLLETALHHSQAEVVYFAASGLIKMDFPCFEESIDLIMGHSEPEIRVMAANQSGYMSSSNQKKLVDLLKEDGRGYVRRKANIAGEHLLATEELLIWKEWYSDPEKSEWRAELGKLIHEFQNTNYFSTRAVRVALGSPVNWDKVLPLLNDLRENPLRNPLEAVARHLGKMKTTQSRTALPWLFGIDNKKVFEIALAQILEDEGMESQYLLDALNSNHHRIIRGVILVAGKLKEAPYLDLAITYSQPGWGKAIRANAIKLLEKTEPSETQHHILKRAFLQGGDFASHANQVVENQSDMRHLKLLLWVYEEAIDKTKGRGGHLNGVTSFFAGQKVRNMAFQTGSKIIQKEQENPRYLLCKLCLTRTEKVTLGPWNYHVCRICKASDHLLKQIKSVVGVVGEGFEPVGNPEGDELVFDVWNETKREFRKADFDVLRIKGGADFDYDWAINAVLEKYQNNTRSTGKIKVQLINQPPLSENTKRMLGKYGSL